MANDTSLTIIGNLTDDPELRFLPSGAAMAKFTIASTPRFMDKASGEWKDGEALFVNCTAWRELAENAAESLSKGARVIVAGRLRQSRWETPEGEKRSAYGLDVEEIGPSLRFARAKVQKMTRIRAGADTTPPDDPWASASTARPDSAAPTSGFEDEPPF